MEEKRAGKDRRGQAERRLNMHSPWIMRIALLEKRGPLDRRSGLDRRESLRADFHREGLVQITPKGIIQRWEPAKGKMTYLWDKGLKAITFAGLKKGVPVEVSFNFPAGHLALEARVLRVQKIFTEHGFAAEVDFQFKGLNEHKKSLINQIIWGD